MFWGKVWKMGHYQKKRKKGQKERQHYGQTIKRGDRKEESNENPEIPDRRETSDISGLPTDVP